MKLRFFINNRECFPNYPGSISITCSRASGERYYRKELDSDLTFTNANGDYDWIFSQPFDTKYSVTIYDVGSNQCKVIWKGVFYKTDCKVDLDHKTITVKPSIEDIYSDLLNGMNNEYDLVSLAPKVMPIKMLKRAILQIYVVNNGNVGDNIVTNYLGGVTWEQNASIKASNLSASGTESYLKNRCKFTKMATKIMIRVNGAMGDAYIGDTPIGTGAGTWTFNNDNGKTLQVRHYYVNPAHYYTEVSIISNGATISQGSMVNSETYPSIDEVRINDMTLEKISYDVYMRYLLDKENVSTATIMHNTEDIIEYSMNYRYVMPYPVTPTAQFSQIIFSTDVQVEPTKYKKNQFGFYFKKPSGANIFPIAQSTWSSFSLWFQPIMNNHIYSADYAQEYRLNDAYPLYSVIDVLIKKIVPDSDISHDFSTLYSHTFYNNYEMGCPFIVPNSNIKKTYYENPAQKGSITLRQVLDMLKDCFNIYWFIDEQDRFRLEHLSWFEQRNITIDTTTMIAPKSCHPWSYRTNKFSYDKVELPERVEWSYAEKQTTPFNNVTLQYKSNYVQKGEVEKITITNFCADVDYMISMGDSVSDDGFTVLLPDDNAGNNENPELILPIYSVKHEGNDVFMQNSGMTRMALFQSYGRYGLSGSAYEIDSITNETNNFNALSLHKAKKQEITFPGADLDPMGLVKTELGNGEIESYTWTLFDNKINATLSFNTED